MLLTLLLLPLFGSILAGFGSRFIGRKGSAILTTSLMAISVFLSFIIFFHVAVKGRLYFMKIGT